MATIRQVIEDFDKYERQWKSRRDDIPYELKTSIIRQIVRTGSIDTARFIQAVDFRETVATGNNFRYLIDSARNREVTYDGFLEFGTRRKNAFGVLINARYNFRDGIQNARIEPIADSIADISFAR